MPPIRPSRLLLRHVDAFLFAGVKRRVSQILEFEYDLRFDGVCWIEIRSGQRLLKIKSARV